MGEQLLAETSPLSVLGRTAYSLSSGVNVVLQATF